MDALGPSICCLLQVVLVFSSGCSDMISRLPHLLHYRTLWLATSLGTMIYAWFASGDTDEIGCSFLNEAALVSGLQRPIVQNVLIRMMAKDGRGVSRLLDADSTKRVEADDVLQFLDVDSTGVVSVTEFIHGLSAWAIIAQEISDANEAVDQAFEDEQAARVISEVFHAAEVDQAFKDLEAAAAVEDAFRNMPDDPATAPAATTTTTTARANINPTDSGGDADEDEESDMDSDEELPDLPPSDSEDEDEPVSIAEAVAKKKAAAAATAAAAANAPAAAEVKKAGPPPPMKPKPKPAAKPGGSTPPALVKLKPPTIVTPKPTASLKPPGGADSKRPHSFFAPVVPLKPPSTAPAIIGVQTTFSVIDAETKDEYTVVAGDEEKIKSVKKSLSRQIKEKTGDECPPQLQQLLFGGGKLKDDIKICAYGIANGSVLDLITQSPKMTFSVQTESGKTIPIEATVRDSVASVKLKLHMSAKNLVSGGLPPGRQGLIFGGKKLQNQATLKECGVTSGSMVFLFAKAAPKPSHSAAPDVGGGGSRADAASATHPAPAVVAAAAAAAGSDGGRDGARVESVYENGAAVAAMLAATAPPMVAASDVIAEDEPTRFDDAPVAAPRASPTTTPHGAAGTVDANAGAGAGADDDGGGANPFDSLLDADEGNVNPFDALLDGEEEAAPEPEVQQVVMRRKKGTASPPAPATPDGVPAPVVGTHDDGTEFYEVTVPTGGGAAVGMTMMLNPTTRAGLVVREVLAGGQMSRLDTKQKVAEGGIITHMNGINITSMIMKEAYGIIKASRKAVPAHVCFRFAGNCLGGDTEDEDESDEQQTEEEQAAEEAAVQAAIKANNDAEAAEKAQAARAAEAAEEAAAAATLAAKAAAAKAAEEVAAAEANAAAAVKAAADAKAAKEEDAAAAKAAADAEAAAAAKATAEAAEAAAVVEEAAVAAAAAAAAADKLKADAKAAAQAKADEEERLLREEVAQLEREEAEEEAAAAAAAHAAAAAAESRAAEEAGADSATLPRTLTLDTSNGQSVGMVLKPGPGGTGLRVQSCVAGGRADTSGKVLPNDLITHINGTDITSLKMAEIGPLIKATTSPTFTLCADGEGTPAPAPAPPVQGAEESEGPPPSLPSMPASLVSQSRSLTLDTSNGQSVGMVLKPGPGGFGLCVQSCVADGQADKSGKVLPNDLITHIDGTDITSLKMAEIGPLIKATNSPKFTLLAPDAGSNVFDGSAGGEAPALPREIQLDTSNGQSVGMMLKPAGGGKGLTVQGVVPGQQAENTGMVRLNDIITHINGTDIQQLPMAEIVPLIKATTSPSFRLRAGDGSEGEGEGGVASLPPPPPPPRSSRLPPPPALDLAPRHIELDSGKSLGLSLMPNVSAKGLTIQGCEPGGQAEATGQVRTGDSITHVNGVDVRAMTAQEITAEIKKGSTVMMTLQQPDPGPHAATWNELEVDLSGGAFAAQSPDDHAGMVAALQSPHAVTQVLNLAKNPVGPDIGKALTFVLKLNTSLTVLNLHACRLSTACGKGIAESLRSNKTLKELDLSGNEFEEATAKALGAMLKKNGSLEILNLSASGADSLGADGAVEIAKALQTNKSLKVLLIAGSATTSGNVPVVGDKGARAMVEALKQNASLLTLDMSYNDLGDQPGVGLEIMLKSNVTLKTLTVSNNKFTKKTGVAIGGGLGLNTTLTTLVLNNNQLKQKGVMAILKGIDAGSIGTGSLSTLSVRENKLSAKEREKAIKAWSDKGKLEI